MRVSDKAIVLQSIRYGDKKFILKLYTQKNGLVTAITHVGTTAKSKIKSSSILPLNLMDVELILKQNKEIHQLTEASCYHINLNITQSFSKLSIAQFLNEILIKCLKEQQPNAHLFEFIETCLKFLNDKEDNYENLHLYFLCELTKYLGFEPQNNYSTATRFFDCRAGLFSPYCLALPLGLSENDSALFSEFLKINALKTKINHQQRQTVLDSFLAYYKLHIPEFNTIKSIDVLREISVG